MTEKPALPPELRSWREHVCACQASGQTMVAYAKAHRLSVKAFYRAKARLMRYGAGQRPPSRSVFQRVKVVSGPVRLSSCRVHLPERGGRGVRGGGSGARPGAASGRRVS